MGLGTILLLITFSTLAILGLLKDEARRLSFSRSWTEWFVDALGLFVQGVIIPLVPFLAAPLLAKIFPTYHGTVVIPSVVQFLLGFVVVDYGYYWNHRFFHGRKLWSLHRLHHTSRFLDFFATSRNSFLTSFFFIYVWVQILAMYFLNDPTAFLLGLSATFALDLWRHSGAKTHPKVKALLNWFLILPEEHVLHHSTAGRHKNFGANINWWDKLHGTHSEAIIPNANLEIFRDEKILEQVFVPWGAKR